MAKKQEFTCPYCREVSRANQIHFRCEDTRVTSSGAPFCPEVNDNLLERYERGPRKPIKAAIIPSYVKGIPKSAHCACGYESFKILCPKCHNVIARSTLNGNDILISIIGTRGSGKSNFIGVAIKELKDRIIPLGFDASMNGLNDDINKQYHDTYGVYLYPDYPKEPQKLPKTASAVHNINNGAYRPYIYSVRFTRKALFKTKYEDFNLVIFDVAGEDVAALERMRDVTQYISKSAGIIFLVDPTQIPEISNRIPTEIKMQSSESYETLDDGSISVEINDTAENVIQRMSELIAERLDVGPRKTIDIPVAAVFSKIDALKWDTNKYIEPPILDGSERILETSPHCEEGAFDLGDHYQVQEETHGLLGTWHAKSFMQLLDTHYKTNAFFSVSSLGFDYKRAPDGTTTKPSPHRVEDPFLWILKENNIIKSKGGTFSLKEFFRGINYRLRIFSGMFKLVSLLILLVLIAVPTVFALVNMRNFNDNAFMHVTMVEVTPRTNLSGPTTISANFTVDSSNFGWGFQRVEFALVRLSDGEVIDQNRSISFFSYWIFNERSINLFTHDFADLSDYLLTVYLNGFPFRTVELAGR
ncbi:MAG: hypothetical protein FWE11_06690 [Defluviitaleaceae bacterium]|nr:hypothetical protein [Defluviitaleaceae bacterium]